MKEKILFIISIIVLLVWVLVLIFSIYSSGTFGVETSYQEPLKLDEIMITDFGEIPYYWEKKLIEDIAWELANEKEYELHVYDCTQFSEKLVSELKKKNLDAQCTAGQLTNVDYPDHTWVSVFLDGKRIEVEATGGYIIEEEEFEVNYVKKWENYCW